MSATSHKRVIARIVGVDVAFGCFDGRLNNAANLLGLKTPFLEP
jgi:hypothetical protein